MKGSNMSYEHNIFWSDIPRDAQIYDMGQSWVVHMPDGRKGLVYWTGETAGKAQAMLKMRALPKERMPCKKWRWNGFPGDECVCGAPKIHHEHTKVRKEESNHTLAAQRKDVKRIRNEHPEIYGKSPGSCTIVCKFPRKR